jgi:hypothetical protein
VAQELAVRRRVPPVPASLGTGSTFHSGRAPSSQAKTGHFLPGPALHPTSNHLEPKLTGIYLWSLAVDIPPVPRLKELFRHGRHRENSTAQDGTPKRIKEDTAETTINMSARAPPLSLYTTLTKARHQDRSGAMWMDGLSCLPPEFYPVFTGKIKKPTQRDLPPFYTKLCASQVELLRSVIPGLSNEFRSLPRSGDTTSKRMAS